MNKSKLRIKYEVAKSAKVGENVECPSCGTSFLKTNYQSAFCKTKSKTKCKDFYWNNVTETKRNNTTRISPASASWTARQERLNNNFDPHEHEHPFSTEALGQWDD